MTSNINEFIKKYLNTDITVYWSWWNNTQEQGSRELQLVVAGKTCRHFEVLDSKVRFVMDEVAIAERHVSEWNISSFDSEKRQYIDKPYDVPGTPVDWSPYIGGNVIEVRFDRAPDVWYQFDGATDYKPEAKVNCYEGDRMETKRGLIMLERPRNAVPTGRYQTSFPRRW